MANTKSDLLVNYVAYQKPLMESARDSTFVVANRLYVQQGYQMSDKLKELATKQLSSGVEMVDFANADETAETINRFVREKTQDETHDIIKPESLKPDSRIVLMNTIYMKLDFEKVFRFLFCK